VDRLPSDGRDREPHGFTRRYAAASFGLFLAIYAPLIGGMSVKIQTLVGLEEATRQLGLITGVGTLFALVTQPLVGRLSDRTTSRFGMRKPWIVVGVIGAALSIVAIGLAPNVLVVLIAFCAAQMFSNFAQAAEAVTIADQVPPARRGFVSGTIGATGPIAILVASVGLTFLPGLFLKFAVPAAIGLVLGLWFAFRLKDRILTTRPDRPFGLKEFFGSFVFNPRVYSNLGWAWLTKALIMFGYAAVNTYLTLYVANVFGFTDIQDQLQFSMYSLIISTIFVVGFSVVGGKLSDKLARRRVFVATGGVLLGVGVAIVGLAPLFGMGAGPIVILISQAILGAGAGLFFSVDVALCIEVLPDPANSAKDLGVLNIATTLPATVSPFIAGTFAIPLIDSISDGSGFSVWFLISAALTIVGALLVYKIKGVK
jgi:MFS family permease